MSESAFVDRRTFLVSTAVIPQPLSNYCAAFHPSQTHSPFTHTVHVNRQSTRAQGRSNLRALFHGLLKRRDVTEAITQRIHGDGPDTLAQLAGIHSESCGISTRLCNAPPIASVAHGAPYTSGDPSEPRKGPSAAANFRSLRIDA